VGLALTGGCRSGDATSPPTSGAGTVRAGSSGGTSSDSDADPDERLLLSALTAERRVRAAVVRARARHHRLRRPLAATLQVHQQHVDLLASAVSTPDDGPADVPDRSGSATAELTALARAERNLSRTHAGLALDAASGQVARLLGSLSAAAAQQGQVLGTTVLSRGSGA
jgi:hypothetical protein